MHFALNHITAPRLDAKEFIDLAARLGCSGIELRNDLSDKKLADRAFFDGRDPAEIGAYALTKNVKLLGLSEVYGFNRWSDTIRVKVERLIKEAQQSGAQSISLIPSNDGKVESDDSRISGLHFALTQILPLLKTSGLIALVEPLGFSTSSLRRKREAIEAFKAVGGEAHYKLVHDTFHHHLANETEFFPEETGIVHISGVVDASVGIDQMRDEHRILVTSDDRLGNIEQIKKLLARGYKGAFSYECFAPSVHSNANLERELKTSFDAMQTALDKVSAAS
ncbi:TIM barrel protein [Aestuariivirga litoralis]|nr:TIM barrel protein [Aestuariivirga litoralis]